MFENFSPSTMLAIKKYAYWLWLLLALSMPFNYWMAQDSAHPAFWAFSLVIAVFGIGPLLDMLFGRDPANPDEETQTPQLLGQGYYVLLTLATVPVLIGTTRDEFTLFVALRYLRQGQRYVAGDYPRLLSETFGTDAGAVGAQYPVDRYGGVAQAYSAAVTDGEFACVSERMAADLSRGGPVYTYEFNDRAAPAPEVMRTLPFPVGASHSLELRYLFDVGGAPPLNPAQQRLSDQMIDYWSAFVRTGDPAAEGQPSWPGFDPAGGGGRMSLRADGSRVDNGYAQEHQCPFWAGLREK